MLHKMGDFFKFVSCGFANFVIKSNDTKNEKSNCD